jgi:thiamine pyrophosphate-dependent acetolactate synthase large subunit-like protein
VTRAEDIVPGLREAFYIARSGRPGPVLVDITKDAQQAAVDLGVGRLAGAPARLPPRPRALPDEFERALEMINDGRAPIILAGHGVVQARHGRKLLELVTEDRHPGGADAARPGRLPRQPPAQPGHDGHARRGLGQQAIQEADLLLAFGMRFDDRVTGNLATYAPQAQEDPRRHRPRRDQQEREGGRRPSSAICARRAEPAHPQVEPATASPWRTASTLKGDERGASTSRHLPDTATSTPRT